MLQTTEKSDLDIQQEETSFLPPLSDYLDPELLGRIRDLFVPGCNWPIGMSSQKSLNIQIV